jgi:serine/threonine protein kinase
MQVQLLMIVHHRNLVSLVGYCNEHENMAVVYEYMANGNLKEQLLGIYRITLRNIEFFNLFWTQTSLQIEFSLRFVRIYHY